MAAAQVRDERVQFRVSVAEADSRVGKPGEHVAPGLIHFHNVTEVKNGLAVLETAANFSPALREMRSRLVGEFAFKTQFHRKGLVENNNPKHFNRL